jgi:hypothetical protein
VRLLANAPCPRPKNCLLLFADWMTSVLLATGGASAGKSCVLAPSSVRPTVLSGSARWGIEATDSTEWNCARPLRPLVVVSLRTNSRKRAPCYGSMANMARGPCWQTWLVSPL